MKTGLLPIRAGFPVLRRLPLSAYQTDDESLSLSLSPPVLQLKEAGSKSGR